MRSSAAHATSTWKTALRQLILWIVVMALCFTFFAVQKAWMATSWAMRDVAVDAGNTPGSGWRGRMNRTSQPTSADDSVEMATKSPRPRRNSDSVAPPVRPTEDPQTAVVKRRVELDVWRQNPRGVTPFDQPVAVLYPGSATWERNATFAEYFPRWLYPRLNVIEHDHNVPSGARQRELLAEIPPERRVLIAQPPVVNCHHLESLFNDLKPSVFFLFSDEMSDRNCHHDLARRKVKLSFRQYSGHTAHYNMDGRSMFQLPLAWLPGTFDPMTYDRAKLTPASKRELIWSFVGDLKADRFEMVKVLSALQPNRTYTGLSMDRREMVEGFYKRSAFVPVGRGFVRLDCSRIYEGSKAGAIPVMVAPRSEVADAFGHFFDVVEAPEARVEHFPPWIIAETWVAALAEMRTLLADPDELDRRQRAVLDFYEAIVLNVRFAVYQQLATGDFAVGSGSAPTPAPQERHPRLPNVRLDSQADF